MKRLSCCVGVLLAIIHSNAFSNELFSQINAHKAEMAGVRKTLHQMPEIKLKEVKTAAYIADYMKQLGYEVQTGFGGTTGVVALLESGKPGKTVALRAEMDGLPITEQTKLPYKSQHDGMMHACGHDGHMTTALLAAKVLAARKNELRGRVKFIFQPGEESGAGAKALVDAGVLENPKVDAIFGYHNYPLPKGHVATRLGTIMASSDHFEITLKGKGGHAATPHLTRNPILAGAQIIQNLQLLVSQKNPTDAALLNIGAFQSGTTTNVIPDSAIIKGTFRTVSSKTRDNITKKLAQIVQSTCTTLEMECDVQYVSTGYPPTVNRKESIDLVLNAAREVSGHVYLLDQPVMPAEDFAFYLEKVPGNFFFVGFGDDKPALHTATYNFDDDILPTAAYVLSRTALNFLNS